jgi:hypothetical protein
MLRINTLLTNVWFNRVQQLASFRKGGIMRMNILQRSALLCLLSGVLLSGCSPLGLVPMWVKSELTPEYYTHSEVSIGTFSDTEPEQGFVKAVQEGTFVPYVLQKTQGMTDAQKLAYYKNLGAHCDADGCKMALSIVNFYKNSCVQQNITNCQSRHEPLYKMEGYGYILPDKIIVYNKNAPTFIMDTQLKPLIWQKRVRSALTSDDWMQSTQKTNGHFLYALFKFLHRPINKDPLGPSL